MLDWSAFGPAAAAVIGGLVLVVLALWKEHLKADVDDRDQRDHAQAIATEALAGWREQTAATNRLAAAIEARNRRDAKQGRVGDP